MGKLSELYDIYVKQLIHPAKRSDAAGFVRSF